MYHGKLYYGTVWNDIEKKILLQNMLDGKVANAEGLRHELEENGELVKFIFSDKEVVAEQESDGNHLDMLKDVFNV